MKKILFLSIAILLLTISGAGFSYSQPAFSSHDIPENIILFSWDGLDRSVVVELLENKKLPNLRALIDEGSFQNIDVVGHATCTKPGHAEMLTGLAAEVTGVFTNSEYQPIPEGYSIFERVQKHLGGKDRIRTFMVTGKLAHVGGRSAEEVKAAASKVKGKKAQKKALRQAYSSTIENKGEPFFITKKNLDVFDGIQRDASVTGPLCLKYLEQFKEPRFLAFLHFSDPDHMGHKNSMDSKEYRQAAIDCDFWLGEIVKWLKDNSIYNDTLIYVMTDHGFDKGAKTHSNAPASWLATNDKLVSHGGILADVPTTILARFGVDIKTLKPELLGKPLF